METSPLLLVPEEEQTLEWPDVENELTHSLSCFGCCIGQREDGGEKWWVQRWLSRSIKWVKEYSEDVTVEVENY
ncbi:hypothetical protein SUGI_0656010 [Cryptomeria japonica]|nr:hypothetical protein SUGI_0656010 [Cryptomeria japonica]